MRSLAVLLTLLAQPSLATLALAEVPRVATDTPVTHSLATMVMGDLGAPELLLDRGADAHDFQLRPSQRAVLGEADLVFWIGPAMTPWLERALDGSAPGKAIALLDLPGLTLRRFDEHASDHDHGAVDPHAWLDPRNALVWLDEIATALAARDPDNAAAYRTNAAAARGAIVDRAGRIANGLAGHTAPIVTAHDALGYFADRFAVTIADTVAAGDAAAPGAAHLSALRTRMETGEIACIFPEAGADPAIVETLAEGTETRIGRPLDPEGRLQDPGADLYGNVLTATGDAIRDCLEGQTQGQP